MPDDATLLNGSGLPVTIVHACLREGGGGSPTAVLDEMALSDGQRRAVPAAMGTSHAVFVSVENDGHGGDDGHDEHRGHGGRRGHDEHGGHGGHGGRRGHDGRRGPDVSLRFFTATGELPACGHGTVAALAFLAERTGGTECRATVRTPGRVFTGRAARVNGGWFEAAFDPGRVDVCEPAAREHDCVLNALGVTSDTLAPGSRVAALGRPRLLVPVSTRSALAALAPDFDRLRDACDRLGLLGCYAYCLPSAEGGRVTARMFAPSIGVPEDIANANSTACLAAYLAHAGVTDITVDMGDALGKPATIIAGARRSEAGPRVHVGGAATISRVVPL